MAAKRKTKERVQNYLSPFLDEEIEPMDMEVEPTEMEIELLEMEIELSLWKWSLNTYN